MYIYVLVIYVFVYVFIVICIYTNKYNTNNNKHNDNNTTHTTNNDKDDMFVGCNGKQSDCNNDDKTNVRS